LTAEPVLSRDAVLAALGVTLTQRPDAASLAGDVHGACELAARTPVRRVDEASFGRTATMPWTQRAARRVASPVPAWLGSVPVLSGLWPNIRTEVYVRH
jgi:hypothetical protein